ncbi:MAG: hypothetical protein KGO81_10935 [Bacteroidota bacterium]|nr:hypothetical protein [Bacteroidota bacterium]
MKKLITLSTTLLLLTTATMAQEQHKWDNQRPLQHHRMEMAKKMAHHLNLSPEQKAQAKKINANYHQKLAALQANDKISLGEYKQQSAALRRERKDQMQHLLTTDQKAKIEQTKNNRQINVQAMAAARMERMRLQLGLNDEQVAKLKAQQTANHEKMKAIHENDTLLPEQKKAQVQALLKEQKENFRSMLTKEQLDKLESLKQNRKMSR